MGDRKPLAGPDRLCMDRRYSPFRGEWISVESYRERVTAVLARNCPRCGAAGSDRAKFCTKCGSQMHAAAVLSKTIVIQNRYVVEHEIKRGGMGCVYRARDTRLNNSVAVKKMLPYSSTPVEKQEAETRFRREAELLSKLHHGGLPKVMDYFTDFDPDDPSRTAHFLVMTLIDGKDLDTIISTRGRKPFPTDKVTDYFAQTLRILHYLHSQSPPIIYRDMNPRNIMVKDGKIFLVDFGIARLFTPQMKATNIGTPGYAPIEQCKGFAEPRSDLYSLGAVVHYLLTGVDPEDPGRPPFSFAPVRKSNPSVPEYLDELIMALLADRCDDRPQSAEKVLKMLDAGPQGKTALISVKPSAAKVRSQSGDIFEAVRKSDEAAVRAFIASGTDIDRKNRQGNTPLHCAAGMGRKDIAGILVKAGASVNARDRRFETPLHKAAAAGRKETAELLLSCGADLNAVDGDGATPLHRAVTRGARRSVELLLSSGAYVNAKDRNGFTPLHIAVEKDRKELVALLVNHGALVSEPDLDGCTPLHLAAFHGHQAVALMLLNEGAETDVKNAGGETPADFATQRGYRDIREMLARHRPSSSVKWTGSAKSAAGQLKSGGAGPQPSQAGMSNPRSKANQPKHSRSRAQASPQGPAAAVVTPEILKQLERAGKYSDIFDAAGSNDMEALKGFIARGVDPNSRSKGGMTLLHIAALRGARAIAELMISKGADVNSRAANGWTPLHCEAWIGRTELTEILISNGADINARDIMGKTPLKTAQEKGHRKTAELLRRHRARGGGFLGLW